MGRLSTDSTTPLAGTSVASFTVVAASGDTTGATDRAAINAALAANRGVRGVAGSTYYIDGTPLLVSSGNVLDLTGCNVTQASGAVGAMIRNAAVTPTTTATDGAVSGGTSFTSPTIAAVAQIGDTIGFVGAGPGGSVWYGVVTAVNTGTNTVTLGVSSRTVVASGGTVYRFTTRDADISVVGGKWTANDPGQNGHSATATALNNFISVFRRVDRLNVSGWAMQHSSGSQHAGGRFAISVADATDVEVGHIRFISTVGDGVHITGPAQRISIHDIFGNTGDDFVVVNTMDSNTPTITDTEGSLFDISCERLFPAGAWSPGKIYDFDAPKDFTINNVTFRSLKGSASNPFQILCQGPVYGTVVDDVAVRVPSGTEMVRVTASSAQDVLISNVTWTAGTASNGIVNIATGGRNVTVQDVRMMTSPTGTNIGVKVGSSPVSYNLSVSRIKIQASVGTFFAVQLNGGSLIKLSLSDCYLLTSTSGILIHYNAATTISHIMLSDIVAAVTTGVQTIASSAATVIRACNVSFAGTRFVQALSPATLEAVNCDFNTSGPIVNVSGAGATPVVAYLSNFGQAGAGANAAKDATQTVTVNVANYTPTSI